MASPTASASELEDARPLTRDIITLRFDDGFVAYHGYAQSDADDTTVQTPLDTNVAGQASTYVITSPDDPAYAAGLAPLTVHRKSKAEDFSRDCLWNGSQCENEIVFDHTIHLRLPSPMQPGATYTVTFDGLNANVTTATLSFDPHTVRSEAVRVNQVGYRPSAPKYAYVSAWLGDGGALDLDWLAGQPFSVLDAASRTVVFTGTTSLRGRSTVAETGQVAETPGGNYAAADVWECDFSELQVPGDYVVSVDGVGHSYPFAIDDDIYREAFRTVTRGLYHHRAGVDRGPPLTEWNHPADHRPDLGTTILYTTARFMDQTSENGDETEVMDGVTGPLTDTWGWYHDAGDWDGYPSHFRVPKDLMTVYERAACNFTDGELNLPSGTNGVPDILDEAAWLVQYFRRNVGPTGGIFGARVHGDFAGSPGAGVPSWEDPRTWICYGEEPLTSYEFAGIAAHLTLCWERAGVADDTGLIDDALAAWHWAENAVTPAEGPMVRDARLYAAACLYRATADPSFQVVFAEALVVGESYASVFDFDAQRHGIWAYLMADDMPGLDAALQQDLETATVQFAEDWNMFAWERRNFRFGGYWWMPMLVGQGTTPWMLATVAAHHLTDDPRYLDALTTTSDYFLGGNPLNTVWVTGLGDRRPEQVLHLDSWYDTTAPMVTGIVPYGPHRGDGDGWVGPWDVDYARDRGVYPAADAWPGHELFFENRYCPITNEYTVHQNIGPAAAVYGYLCAPQVGTVGTGDLLAVLAAWGPCVGCPADRNGDGVVDVNDLLAVLAAWGTATCG